MEAILSFVLLQFIRPICSVLETNSTFNRNILVCRAFYKHEDRQMIISVGHSKKTATLQMLVRVFLRVPTFVVHV